MGRRGRPTAQIVLTDVERETLQRWARRPTTGQALAMRCTIVLAASTGATNRQIAAEVGCNPTTVGKWRTRFAARRPDGLMDEPRPGQPRKITDEVVEEVIVTTLEEVPPDGSTQWSTRSMAARVGLNRLRSVGSGGRSGSSRLVDVIGPYKSAALCLPTHAPLTAS